MKLLKPLLLISAALLAGACTKEKKVSLETVEAQVGELTETVTATGTIESVTQVDVGTQVTGIIDKLYADYNTIVNKGDLIAEIEKTMLQSDLRSAEANVESARLTYEYNRTNYERDKALHDKQLISDYEYQTSLKDYQVSKASYDKAQADKVRAAKNLNYAEIYSPIDGIVISREVEVGQTVVSNIGQVKVGQKVTFSVDAYPDDLFEGKVTQVRLNPTTESNVVTYEVVVAAPNPDHKLIPGLTANLTIYVMSEENVLLLPNTVFTFEPQDYPDVKNLPQPQAAVDKKDLAPGQKSLWVVEGNSLVNKIVTVGTGNGMKTVISGGLQAGAVVATGYEEAAAPSADPTVQKSPFAPQPPGRKNKK